ncbi:hypothetical protein PDIG_55830 [Penicillium digitatum PHI26]|uniref:C6 finger domain protein n=2 Tax=Penicillium digitatum TaxID=36651 RepID=K9G6T2_PEND2|nr:hypothetical protein PDIP_65400 [Penicillium digitatum Pd1]EKV09255.1 hypothetical protein PDIP_65400 [Penicillium digitatum Pd1]EKV10528.1 hypothetical protein PDIG_55830 [Penicillium digitatum PHI26]
MFRDESKSVIRKAVAALTHKNKQAERSRRTAIPEGNTLRSRLSFPVEQDFDFNSDPQHVYLMRQLRNYPLEVQPSHELEATKYEAVCYLLRSNAIPSSFWTTDIEEAKTIQTLSAVALLAVYEIITSRAPENIDGWTNHINGATALLDLRGTDQLKTNAGLHFFLYLQYRIIISCLQRDERVPESLLHCTEIAMFLDPAQAHGNRLVMIIGKLSNLRADIRINEYKNEREILTTALAIEANLIAWLAALPPELIYTTHISSPFDFAIQKQFRGISPYDDHYHVYPSLWVCSLWNQYRSARILVGEIILTHVRKLSDSSSSALLSEEFHVQCRTLRLTTRRLAVEICRSVPFHFNVHLVDKESNIPPPESYIGGLVLLWHLFVAGIVESPQHRLRRWVVKCLEMIGNSIGIDLALAVADIVAADPGILLSVTEADTPEVFSAPDLAREM